MHAIQAGSVDWLGALAPSSSRGRGLLKKNPKTRRVLASEILAAITQHRCLATASLAVACATACSQKAWAATSGRGVSYGNAWLPHRLSKLGGEKREGVPRRLPKCQRRRLPEAVRAWATTTDDELQEMPKILSQSHDCLRVSEARSPAAGRAMSPLPKMNYATCTPRCAMEKPARPLGSKLLVSPASSRVDSGNEGPRLSPSTHLGELS
jgi:hypothetical protein